MNPVESLKRSIQESCELLLTKMWNDSKQPFDMWLSIEGGNAFGYIFQAQYRNTRFNDSNMMYEGKLCVYKLQCFMKEDRAIEDIQTFVRSYIQDMKIEETHYHEPDESIMSYFS